MLRVSGWLVVAATACALTSGCRQTLPKDGATSALYRDLQRLVALSTVVGWEIDRVEYRDLLSDSLMSVCRVPVDKRVALATWLDARIKQLGGPVEKAYQNRGRDLSKVAALLELTRVRGLLKTAASSATTDCPFWLRPDKNFRGQQLTDNRWLITLSGGGKAIGVLRGKSPALSGGGAGRLLFGRAFGSRWTFLVGGEVGGSGELPRDEGDEQGVVLSVDFVAPLVVRYRFVNTYVELEGGYLYRLTEGSEGSASGGHIGIAFGGRAARRRWLFPGAVFGITLERTFPKSGVGITMVKIGFRAVLDLPF